MATEVKWTLLALNDVEGIAEFIAKDSQHYASLQVEKFFLRSEALEQFPYSGKMVEEFGLESIRELIEGNYRIIYRIVSEQRVDILTVHHSNRLLSNNPLFKK